MIDSNFVTQDQRLEDLEDVAYLKKRVFELEGKIEKLESLISKNNTGYRKHKDQVTSFIGFVPIERKSAKNADRILESVGE